MELVLVSYSMSITHYLSRLVLFPLHRKTITNQKVILIKTTGAMMIEQAAIDLAYPTMTCPLTGKRFTTDDVVELKAAHSGLTARGGVEGKLHRPSMN